MYETFAYYYDSLGWERFSHVQADLFLNFVRKNSLDVKTVLDVACGTGTFCFLMADNGIKATGIDLAKDMLAVAKKKVKDGEYRDVRFHRKDMRKFDLNRRFDFITCNFDSLNHLLTEEDVRSTFENVRGHLNEEGVFVFDVSTIAGLYNWQFRETIQRKDHVILRHGVFDEECQTALMFIDALVKTEGEHYIRFQDTFKEKGYPIRMIHKWLREAGLPKVRPIGPSQGKSVKELEHDPRVFLCASE